jgi:uncharacterized protein (DUF362 family)
MTKVQLFSGENRRKAVKMAVDALPSDFIKRAKEAEYILIKPDLVHHSLQLASTHVDAIRGILDVLKMYTDAYVIIGDSAHYGTKQAFRNLEYETLQREYKNLSLCDLSDDAFIESTIRRSDGSELVVRRSKIAVEAPLSISVSPMKTHKQLDASLSIVSWAEGTWLVPPRMTADGQVWSRAPWLYSLGNEEAHSLVAALFASAPCHVSVIDGILGMEGDGPVGGTPIHMGLALAGMDPVAVDAAAAMLMGFDPHEIPYLELSANKGLGVNEISRIDIPPLVLQENMKFFTRA